jgi:ATP-dependent protease ClpP protease subunit
MYRIPKRNKRKLNYDEITNDDDNDTFVNRKHNSFFDLFNSQDDDVYIEENHIYFKTDVNMKSIDKLCKLIREYKHKFSDFKNRNSVYDLCAKPLYIHITTYGGDLYASVMCYDIIKNSSIPIYTIAEGYTASAGTIMCIAGHKRYITQNSVYLIHQLRTGMNGKFEELVEELDNSKKDMNRIINLYFDACKGKLTKMQIKQQLKKDKWFNAKECIKYGLVDEIYNDY